MIKVRFLEGCYVFSTGKSYNPNDIVDLEEGQANRLFKRGVVDILKDEEYVIEEEEEEEKTEQVELDELTVAELRDIANEKEIVHSGLKKAELIKAIEEVS